MSGLREFLGGLQVSVPVSQLAKWKTTLQLVALGALILAGALPALAVDAQVGRARLSVGRGGADAGHRLGLSARRPEAHGLSDAIEMLYFAWVREAHRRRRRKRVDPPAEVTTVADLIDWLAARSDGHAEALRRSRPAARGGRSGVRAARRADRRRARGRDLPAGDRRMIRVVVTRRRRSTSRAELARARGARAAARWRPSPGWSAPTTASATLELEHYPGATEAALTELAEEAVARWSLAARRSSTASGR